MATYREIKVELRSQLAIITFNRPKKKNSFNTAMYEEIIHALNELSENDITTITVLTGFGEYYSSGTDIQMRDVGSFDKYVAESTARVRRFVNAFINHKKILVAVVNGPAIGIAVTTLGLCDIVYCTDTATFQTPFTHLGLIAEGCSSYTFQRIIGTSKSNEMLLFNYKMTATEALKVGLVSHIYKKEQLDSELWPQLEKYAKLPYKSLLSSKELIRRFDKDSMMQANAMECELLTERLMSDEFIEAVVNFRSRSKL